MSKYNRMASISISSLSEQELPIAIREWAEGNVHMESLLWACYKNGIETDGCHVDASPYISFHLDSKKEEVLKLLNVAQNIKGASFFVMPDGGNPIKTLVLVRMRGMSFVVLISFFVILKVTKSIHFMPFPFICVFFYFNHIFAYFSLSVYRACTLFILHLVLQSPFLLPLGINVNKYFKSSQHLNVLIFLPPLEC